MLYMDCNSQFGRSRGEEDENKNTYDIDTPTCGRYGRGVENENGRLIREFLERYQMKLIHTMSNNRPSYYSPVAGRTSHIDHIAIPASMMNIVEPRGSTWTKSGQNTTRNSGSCERKLPNQMQILGQKKRTPLDTKRTTFWAQKKGGDGHQKSEVWRFKT